MVDLRFNTLLRTVRKYDDDKEIVITIFSSFCTKFQFKTHVLEAVISQHIISHLFLRFLSYNAFETTLTRSLSVIITQQDVVPCR